jgi:hypothetical protein
VIDARYTRERQCERCGELDDGQCACTERVIPWAWPAFLSSQAGRARRPAPPPPRAEVIAAPSPAYHKRRAAEWAPVERLECIEARDADAFATLPPEQLPAYAAWRAAQNRASRTR